MNSTSEPDGLFHQKHVLAGHGLLLERGVGDRGVDVAQSHRATLRHIIVEMTTTAPTERIESTGCIPIVGIDDEGMVVFANEEASVELGKGMPLLGNYVAECIPENLQALLARPLGEILLWSAGRTVYRACCRAMDDHHYAQGKLLMLVPEVRERE